MQITLLSNFLKFGPACAWIGTPILNKELHPKVKASHHRLLRAHVGDDSEEWQELLIAVMQLGLHPKDLLPAGSAFGGMLFSEDLIELDNKHLDDEHARSRYGVRLAVERERILKPLFDSYTIAGQLTGSLDVLQYEVEAWLQRGQALGANQLNERLDEIRKAMRRSALTTDGYPAFSSFLQWLDGTEIAEIGEDFEDFTILLKQLMVWRYPRSLEYGPTSALATPLCELDEDMDD